MWQQMTVQEGRMQTHHINPSCLPPAVSAPSLTSFGRLKSSSGTKILDLFCIMLATRSCAKLGRGNTKIQGTNPPHYLILLSIPSDPQPCDPQPGSSWGAQGMLQHWEKSILELLCPQGNGLQQCKNIKCGHRLNLSFKSEFSCWTWKFCYGSGNKLP